MARLSAWLLAATVAVLTSACGSGAGTSRSGASSSPTEAATSTPTAVPTPMPTPLPLPLPPSGVPVFYIAHPGDHSLTAVDDQGRIVGAVPLAAPAVYHGVIPSPDGSAYMTLDQVVDQRGAVLANTKGLTATWADDSRHLCAVGRSPEGATTAVPTTPLKLLTLGGTERTVAMLHDPEGFDAGSSVLACGVTADRAVVAHSVCCSVTSVTVYQLSTGAALHRWEAPTNGDAALGVDASRNGRVVTVETLVGHAPPPATCQVLDSASGRALSAVFTGPCNGFSSDGRLLLLNAQTAALGSLTRLVDWATGQTVRTVPAPVICELPRGGHSLYVTGSGYIADGDSGGTYGTLRLVRDDGSDVQVATNVFLYCPY